jgi:hypothetical protein
VVSTASTYRDSPDWSKASLVDAKERADTGFRDLPGIQFVGDQIVEQFFQEVESDALESYAEALLEHICSSNSIIASNAVDLIIRKINFSNYEDHVRSMALEVLSHCHDSVFQSGIRDVIRQTLVETNSELCFSAIAVLPNLPPNVRAGFQHMIVQISQDESIEADIRNAAKAEVLGFRRRNNLR